MKPEITIREWEEDFYRFIKDEEQNQGADSVGVQNENLS
jgi:hypothetical protein